MIRFGVIASVVSAAVALLIVGALSGDLGLVYVSIGLAALALVMLVIGVAVWRDRVFAGTTPTEGRQLAVDQHGRGHPSPSLAPAASARAGLSQAGPVHAGPVHAGRRPLPKTPGRVLQQRPAGRRARRASPSPRSRARVPSMIFRPSEQDLTGDGTAVSQQPACSGPPQPVDRVASAIRFRRTGLDLSLLRRAGRV